MNVLLTIGLLLIIGYLIGYLLERIGLPAIIGYIGVGVLLSPNSFEFIPKEIIEFTHPLLEICLAFIAFEVGGSLKWSKLKAHGRTIIGITLMASFVPFIITAAGILLTGLLFQELLPFSLPTLLILAVLAGVLASPTAPAGTVAVIHKYKAKGKVTDTLLGVVALDDVLGILLFSLTLAVIFLFNGGQMGLFDSPVLNASYQIGISILTGAILGTIINPVARFFKIKGEGQWVVILFALIIFCTGLSLTLETDVLLSAMTMGMVVANFCKKQATLFAILERYTEDLIFLFFFLLSGLQLDITTLPQATVLIFLFVFLRTAGKYLGVHIGAHFTAADDSIKKYTAGGLLPQAGIVIGLVLNIHQQDVFSNISNLLLTTIMGTTIIFAIIGPLTAKYTLKKAKEIKD